MKRTKQLVMVCAPQDEASRFQEEYTPKEEASIHEPSL
jgi:hypothetical protein